MSNMDSGVDTTITKRRRLNETSTCAKINRVLFRDQSEKSLPQPTLTYHYNMDINQVDQGDQKRASYPVQQRQRKTWKAMFYTLVEIIAINSFTLSAFSYVPKEKKFLDYFAFREALCEGLLAHAKPEAGIIDTASTARRHQKVQIKRAPCVICKQAAAEERRGIKGVRRQALQALSPNIVGKRKERRVNRTRVGCCFCKVALCRERGCWEAFHLGASSGDTPA